MSIDESSSTVDCSNQPESPDVHRFEGQVAADASPKSAGMAQSAVLLSDAKRYRKRAQAAETSLEQLKTDLAEREKTIASQQQVIADHQGRQLLDDALRQADVHDLEAARALARAALSAGDAVQPEQVNQAVAELRRRKPWLFNQAAMTRATSGALGPKSIDDNGSPAIESAAEDAAVTGKRTDLLRYLRLRRNAHS